MNEKTSEKTKKCPSCDETISAKAKKCSHCRQDLRGWFARHPILTILGIIILTPFVLGSFIFSSVDSEISKDTPPKPERKSELNTKVNFLDGQFIITNLEDQNCIEARLKVNGKYALNGYTLEAGSTYTVGSMQFAKKDGTRFNPYNTKPQNLSISCQGDNELTSAFWYGEW